MKQTKVNITKTTIATVIVFALLTGAVAYQFLLIQALSSRQNQEEARTVWNTKLIYACYNHKISPCDDEGVTVWNEQNPDKAITETYLRNPEF